MTLTSSAPRRLTVLELDTERGWRGGERQALWYAEELQRRGHRALIGARPGEPLAQKAAAVGLEVVPCAPRGEFAPIAARALRRVLRREHVDVLHAHTAHAVALGALATRGTDTKFVITRHVDFRLRRNWGTRWKYGRADALLAISEAARQAMIASGVDPARVQVVRGGTDQTREIPAAPRDCLAALGVPAKAPLVVQVSQHVQHKDPLTFVRAIDAARRLIPGVQALLVGDGPLRPAVEREVAARGLRDVLHVVGYRSDADALLAAADVVTLSSEADALPSVLFDALYLGIPIVATAGGGIPEIIEHDVSGLVVPVADGEAMGRAIAAVVSDPALARRLSEGARARAPEFSIARSVDRTLEVYARILGARPGGGAR